jgi:hypothetical protein
MANHKKMRKASDFQLAGERDEAAVSHLGIRWERVPEPFHDYCYFLKRSRDERLIATSSSQF